MGLSAQIRLPTPRTWSSSAAVLIGVSSEHFPRSAPTRLLRGQQLLPDRLEVGQRGGNLQTVQVLGKPAVTDLLEPEHALDHPDRVLDLRVHPQLGAVRGFDPLIDPANPAVALVGEVSSS